MEASRITKTFERFGINARILGILALLLVLWGFLAIYAGPKFYGFNNIENLLKRTALIGILGIGVSFVIITSGIDLSIGSLVCLMACLLSVFLHVDYKSPTLESVIEVRAEQKQLLLPEESSHYAQGDRLRFYGGNYARNAMRTVVSVEEKTTDNGQSVSAITVDEPFSRDDKKGSVVRVHQVEKVEQPSADGEKQLVVVLPGDHGYLRHRDRIDFLKPAADANSRNDHDDLLTNAEIVAAEVQDGKTRVTLDSDSTKLSSDWVAVLKPRHQRMSIAMALGLLFAIALLLGLAHGLLVTKLSLPPFVVTLCGLLIYRGMSRSLMNDQPGGFGNEYETFQQLGAGKWTFWESATTDASFGLPYPFLVLVLVGIAASILLNRTIWGRYLLALGRNEEAARYSGINTSRMIMLAYIIGVFASTVGGILFALHSNSISPSSFGAWFELYAIAAAVLGGCSLRGGEGSIFGVIVGAALMQTLSNLISLLDIPGFDADQIELAVIGAVILIGVSIDEIVRRIVAARRARAVKEATAAAAEKQP